MDTKQLEEAALKEFAKAHRLEIDAPNTYPHVTSYSVKSYDVESREVWIQYFVNNGRTIEERSVMYTI